MMDGSLRLLVEFDVNTTIRLAAGGLPTNMRSRGGERRKARVAGRAVNDNVGLSV